jgi:hypothetical protein
VELKLALQPLGRGKVSAVGAIIGGALWEPYYAYGGYGGYGDYSASAKSRNPGQGYPERQRRER